MIELQTDLPGLELVTPDVDRDPPTAVDWLAGDAGKATLLLMGNTEEQSGPTTLAAEQDRVRGFLASKEQLTWTLIFHGKPVGVIWVNFFPTEYAPSPAIHIMVGDPEARGHGIGRAALEAVISYLANTDKYQKLYTRHLVSNTTVTRLLESVGFKNLGNSYIDSGGLHWQNVVLDLK